MSVLFASFDSQIATNKETFNPGYCVIFLSATVRLTNILGFRGRLPVSV